MMMIAHYLWKKQYLTDSTKRTLVNGCGKLSWWKRHPVKNTSPLFAPRSFSQSIHPFSTGSCTAPWLRSYCSESESLWINILKSLSCLRSSRIFSIEWSTVVWCLPPKARPISGSEAPASSFERNIAICLG